MPQGSLILQKIYIFPRICIRRVLLIELPSSAILFLQSHILSNFTIAYVWPSCTSYHCSAAGLHKLPVIQYYRETTEKICTLSSVGQKHALKTERLGLYANCTYLCKLGLQK